MTTTADPITTLQFYPKRSALRRYFALWYFTILLMVWNILGPFDNPNVPAEAGLAAAKEFAELYNACGKVDCRVTEDVAFSRWRKLVYNACYNSVSTILRLDTSRIRISEHIVDNLVGKV